MQPKLPIFNVPPERLFFYFFELLPNVFFCFLLLLLELIGLVLLCFEKCKCMRKLVSWAAGYTGKLAILIFPTLFSEKKVQVENHEDSKEILFMDKRQREMVDNSNFKAIGGYNDHTSHPTCLGIIFGTMGTMIVCVSALGFFRYFPVTTSSVCREIDNDFNPVFCYNNTWPRNCFDLPLDCDEISVDEQSDFDIICYALSLKIGKSSAVAIGLYHLGTTLILVAVYGRKAWRCIFQKCCSNFVSYCTYGIFCSLLFFIAGLGTALYLASFEDDDGGYDIVNTGELVYKLSQILLFLVPACFFLCIPCLLERHEYDESNRHTYSFLATRDGPDRSLNRDSAN
jgi:hypothetical protein